MPRREVHPDRRNRRLERFEEALRRSARRPVPPPPPWPLPGSSPLAGRRVGARWQLVAASLALVAVLATGLLLERRSVPSGANGIPMPAPAATAALASRDEVLILWLDPDTPLYLTLPTAAEAAPFERSTR